MLVDDGKVIAINLEEQAGKAVDSGAARMLELL
jgi:peroxiredoxin